MYIVQFRISRNYGFALDLLRSAIPPIRLRSAIPPMCYIRLGDTIATMNTLTNGIKSRTYIDADNARYSSHGLRSHET